MNKIKSTKQKWNGGWIKIRGNKKFDFNRLNVEDISIDDYAFALAKINRFTGWTKFPYSVSQHSVLLSKYCPKEIAYECLLHDAHEIFINDLSKPVKDFTKDFRMLENRIEKKVHEQFNLHIPDEVYVLDLRICKAEAEQLIGDTSDWGVDVEPLDIGIIEEWSWTQAEQEFINRYYELVGK